MNSFIFCHTSVLVRMNSFLFFFLLLGKSFSSSNAILVYWFELCDVNIWQVRISPEGGHQIPFGVGMVSDPMALRRGAKQLPMEDVCFYRWPLPGLDQVWGLDPIQPRTILLFLFSLSL